MKPYVVASAFERVAQQVSADTLQKILQRVSDFCGNNSISKQQQCLSPLRKIAQYKRKLYPVQIFKNSLFCALNIILTLLARGVLTNTAVINLINSIILLSLPIFVRNCQLSERLSKCLNVDFNSMIQDSGMIKKSINDSIFKLLKSEKGIWYLKLNSKKLASILLLYYFSGMIF